MSFWDDKNKVGWTFMAVGVVIVAITLYFIYICRRARRTSSTKWETDNDCERLETLIHKWDSRVSCNTRTTSMQGPPTRHSSMYSAYHANVRTSEVLVPTPGSTHVVKTVHSTNDTIAELLNMLPTSQSQPALRAHPPHRRTSFVADDTTDDGGLSDAAPFDQGTLRYRRPNDNADLSTHAQVLEGDTLPKKTATAGIGTSTGVGVDAETNTSGRFLEEFDETDLEPQRPMYSLKAKKKKTPKPPAESYPHGKPYPRILPDCTIYLQGNGLIQGRTGELARFSVRQEPSIGGSCSVTVQCKGLKPVVTIAETDLGVWETEYLPMTAGEYTVSISVNDNIVPGSPFKIHIMTRDEVAILDLRLPPPPPLATSPLLARPPPPLPPSAAPIPPAPAFAAPPPPVFDADDMDRIVTGADDSDADFIGDEDFHSD